MLRPALILSVVAAAIAAAPAHATAPPWGGGAFHPYTVDPWNQDCIPANDPTVGATRDCDPINLVFPDQSLAIVADRLRAAGWTDTTGSIQWLAAGSRLLAVQAQLAQADGPDPSRRFHIRLWELAPGLVVGNVHHEAGSPHRIDMAWDAAEDHAAAPLCAAWCGHVHFVAADAVQGPGGLWRGFANDDDATVAPTSPPAAKANAAKPKKKPRAHRRHRLATPG